MKSTHEMVPHTNPTRQRGRTFSPRGATGNSQGRQPLDRGRSIAISPGGATHASVSPLRGCFSFLTTHQGLTPLAITYRSFGATDKQTCNPLGT